MEPHARSLHYAEVPEHFTWDKKSRKWNRRKVKSVGTKVIGRMYSACPSEGPRFYLYLLLLHRKGMMSFEDLVVVLCGEPGLETQGVKGRYQVFGEVEKKIWPATLFRKCAPKTHTSWV